VIQRSTHTTHPTLTAVTKWVLGCFQPWFPFIPMTQPEKPTSGLGRCKKLGPSPSSPCSVRVTPSPKGAKNCGKNQCLVQADKITRKFAERVTLCKKTKAKNLRKLWFSLFSTLESVAVINILVRRQHGLPEIFIDGNGCFSHRWPTGFHLRGIESF